MDDEQQAQDVSSEQTGEMPAAPASPESPPPAPVEDGGGAQEPGATEPPLPTVVDILKARFEAIEARLVSLEGMAHTSHSLSGESVGQLVETTLGELAQRLRSQFPA